MKKNKNAWHTTFNKCPRCEKNYWIKQYLCKNCSYNEYGKTKMFKTTKYFVSIFADYTVIKSINKIEYDTPFGNFLTHAFVKNIPRQLSIKSTEEDIDKYLILC